MKRLVFALFALVLANTAPAHSLKVFASQDGENVRIKSFFYGNSPCQNCDVKISQNGAVLLEAKTDKTGVLSLNLGAGEYEIEIYGGAGHAKKINFKVENVVENSQNLQSQNLDQNSSEILQNSLEPKNSSNQNLLNFALSLAIIFAIFGALYAIKKRK
ncbi:hypothetical protein OFO07_07005 [Campylobacter sp. JMF_06 NA1]|uniref:hypothetical protein n=1 Tax=Campylobacter sp. JMF_06 NA1 TaxID=2983823 RepID=UPI0022E9C672|nr:hypothetical protein [Campylobacter sp. JMF_06 NA1]MDA3078661.1 hypothetical protein [Campylobacter sp. JMF_06 NA1]